MILIADSGSTKTLWRLVDESKKVSQFLTNGLNPYFKTQEEISEEIKTELIPYFPHGTKVLKIFFYGAGCSSKIKCDLVKNALAQCFQGHP